MSNPVRLLLDRCAALRILLALLSRGQCPFNGFRRRGADHLLDIENKLEFRAKTYLTMTSRNEILSWRQNRRWKEQNMLNRIYQRVTQAALAVTVAAFLAGCEATRPPITHFNTQAQSAENEASLVLHEGDSVKIEFPGAPKFDTTQVVRRDGKITLDIMGEITVVGLTPKQLEQRLLKLYDQQLIDKRVTVSVPSSIFVLYVTGAVSRSGKLTSERHLTPLQAVLEAGIDSIRSNLKDVIVIRTRDNGDTERYKLDLNKVLKHGEPSDPFTLKPLDIIFVPEKFSWL
jgi:polysaccharide export outer membrane protein